MERRRDGRKKEGSVRGFLLKNNDLLVPWVVFSTALFILVAHIGGIDPSKQLSHGTTGFSITNGNPLKAALIFTSESLSAFRVARIF